MIFKSNQHCVCDYVQRKHDYFKAVFLQVILR